MKGVLHQWAEVSARMLAHERIPVSVVHEFERLAGAEADPADLHLCPQGGAYTADQPSPAFDEHCLRTQMIGSKGLVVVVGE